jgi:hypothetical protein
MIAGLLGALAGIAVGVLETRLIAPKVEDRLRALERDPSPAAQASLEGKLRLFRLLFLLINVVFAAVAGYTIARLLFG